MGKYLGLDSSTQSLTGMVIDADDGAISAEVSINFDAHFAEQYGVENGVIELGDGAVHSAPLMWADALDLLFKTLQAQGIELGQIRSIAGSGQQHGTVYLHESAGPTLAELNPRRDLAEQLEPVFSRATAPIWMDTSTSQQCAQVEASVGGREALLALTGNAAFERFSGPQIRKFYQEEPEAYAQTQYIGLVSSFMASVLAGKLVGVDPGDASGTNLMDIRSRQWSAEALRATAPALVEKLLPVVPSCTPVGTVSPYFSARYGLAADCTVLPFSGDNPCSAIGLGLIDPGRVALSLGTSDTLFACMDEPRVSQTGEGCVFALPDDRNYMALVCFLNGSLAREAVRDEYGLDWAGFTAALQATQPGNGGALMLPYFDPEIVPRVSRPTVVRHRLDRTDAQTNVRAVIEAQALSSKIHARWMGIDISSLYVTGGASANRDILRVYADVHNCPVHQFETTNSATLGAALRAAQADRGSSWHSTVEAFTQPVAGSTLHPDPSAVATYARLVDEYEALEQIHVGSAQS